MYAKILILMMSALLLSAQVYAQSTTTPVASDTKSATTTKKKGKKKALKTEEVAATATTTTAPAAPAAAPVVEVKKEEVKKDPELSTMKKVVKYMREHLSATYHGEYHFARRDVESANVEDHKLKDFTVMHNPTLIYNPTKKWQILSTAEFKYSDQPDVTGPAFPNTFYRALFTITRKDILNEKEHVVKLDAGIGRRVFNAGVAGLPLGNDRIFATLTKTYGKHSASLFAQYLYNDVKKSTATTFKHGFEFIPTINLQLTDKLSYMFNDDIVMNTPKYSGRQNTPYWTHEMNLAFFNYQWNDKISTYYQFKYYHTSGFDQPTDPTKHLNADYIEHYAGIAYAFTSKLTLTAEVGNEIFHSSDNRAFFAKKAGFPEATIYLDASL